MDLSLVPTESLLAELRNRCDHMVFSAIRIGGGTESSRRPDEQHDYWGGHALVCVGLAAGLIRLLQDNERGIDDNETNEDG